VNNEKNIKVFLGGTCNGSQWRNKLIKKLNIDYFNPIVDNWNEKAQKNEIRERQNADFSLFVITPLMTGSYAIAEVVDDSNKKPKQTILCVLDEDYGQKWTESQKSSLKAVMNLVESNGAKVFTNLKDVAEFLNDK
jgi:uncharacterized phage-like protein YoqJ